MEYISCVLFIIVFDLFVIHILKNKLTFRFSDEEEIAEEAHSSAVYEAPVEPEGNRIQEPEKCEKVLTVEQSISLFREFISARTVDSSTKSLMELIEEYVRMSSDEKHNALVTEIGRTIELQQFGNRQFSGPAQTRLIESIKAVTY